MCLEIIQELLSSSPIHICITPSEILSQGNEHMVSFIVLHHIQDHVVELHGVVISVEGFQGWVIYSWFTPVISFIK